MDQIGLSSKDKIMTYMLKSSAKKSRWAAIIGSGNITISINPTDLTVKKFPLPNTFYANTGLSCTIASSTITLASKRYIFFVKPFYDQTGSFFVDSAVWSFEFFLYVNGVQLSTAPIIASPGYLWTYAQTAIAMAEYVATAGDQVELRYQKKSNTTGTYDMGVYLNGGALTTNMLGFYIMEVDL